MRFWRIATPLVPCIAMALTSPALAESKIRIGSVPAQYVPPESESGEPVSMAGYHFEVNEETGRARVVVEYTHAIENPGEYDPGPAPTEAQIHGLTWDPATRSVVYDADGKRTVCAQAQAGKHWKLKNTGSCAVTATVGEHTTDDGWRLHRFRAIDTWFEVH